MILIKTWSGIADHFPMRWSEWLMAIPALGMGVALTYQSDMFSLSAAFQALAQWGDEKHWAIAVLLVGILRLIALAVNGSFPIFRYTPHLRLLASFVGGFFWSQFCLGILISYFNNEGALSGVVAYGTLSIIEIANAYRASADVGIWARRRKNARME